MSEMRGPLAAALAASDVVVVSGETGSGKTTQASATGGWPLAPAPAWGDAALCSLPLFPSLTSPLHTPYPNPPQVPQFILEEAILGGHGAETSVVVTQVRGMRDLGIERPQPAELLRA
jgi:hypothetical protein